MVRWGHHAALALGALLLQGCGVRTDGLTPSKNPCLTYIAGRFSEFLVRKDGSVVLFPNPGNGAPRVWKDSRWQESSSLATEGTVRDAVQKPDGSWVILSQPSESEVILYRCTTAGLDVLSQLSGTFGRPALHVAEDDCMWVTSSDGTARTCKDGQTVTHAFGPQIKAGTNSRIYYPPTASLAVPNHGLWFWTHVEHEFLNFGAGPDSAIDGFSVYRGGEWREVPYHSREKLGGAILADSGTVIAGTRYKGVFRVDVRNGTATNETWDLPPNEHCLFMHRTPTGSVLLITARPANFPRMAPTHNGWRGQLLAYENGNMRPLLADVDFKHISHDKGRPVVDVPEGTLLAEPQAGLLFVSADLKTVRRLDWRRGVSLPNIDRMRVFGNALCLLDRDRGFAILDCGKLLRASERATSDNWSVFTAAAAPVLTATGTVCFLEASLQQDLVHYTASGEQRIPTGESQFSAKLLSHLATDTKDRVWLIGNFVNNRTTYLDRGKWRTFDRLDKAYAAVAGEEKGNLSYRLGKPSDPCFPAFSGDGRVAYRDEWGQIRIFDGKQWAANSLKRPFDGKSPRGPPFYDDNELTIQAGDAYYKYVDDRWQPARRPVESPYDTRTRQTQADDLPSGFPGHTGNPLVRTRDSTGAFWAGDLNALWRGLEGIWIPFPTQDSPLCQASGISDIQVDQSGCLWFSLSGGDYTRLARYKPSEAPPVLEWAKKPNAVVETRSVDCAVRVTGPSTIRLLRYQVNDGAWQRVPLTTPPLSIRVDDLTNGFYSLRAQAHDSALSASKPLECAFTVQRDYDREIRLWTKLLSSPDFSRRELAAKALAGIGAHAMPALREMEARADSSAQWWARAVREEIERRAGRTLNDEKRQGHEKP